MLLIAVTLTLCRRAAYVCWRRCYADAMRHAFRIHAMPPYYAAYALRRLRVALLAIWRKHITPCYALRQLPPFAFRHISFFAMPPHIRHAAMLPLMPTIADISPAAAASFDAMHFSLDFAALMPPGECRVLRQ